MDIAQNVERLLPHTPTPLVNIALSMTLWSIGLHAKRAANAAITFYDF